MDKNTVIGFILIMGILVVFSFLQRPSQQQLLEQKRYNDSIAYVRQMEIEAEQLSRQISEQLQPSSEEPSNSDLTKKIEHRYGNFSKSTIGKDTMLTLENNKIKLHISTLGGTISSAELKEYRTYKDTLHPLALFRKEDMLMSFTLISSTNRIIATKDLYFCPIIEKDSMLTMRLYSNDSNSYLDFCYTLHPNDYMVDFTIKANNPRGLIAQNTNSIEMQWSQKVLQLERGRKFEERYSQLEYMLSGGDIEQLSEQKHDTQREVGQIKWIAYKNQFFSTVLIADKSFSSSVFESTPQELPSSYIKDYSSKASFDFSLDHPSSNFHFYMGPNHYNTLKAYDEGRKNDKLNLQELVPLGWKIVSWINKLLVIPMFDLFTRWKLHIGIVILLMTIVIKIIILPFVFASYKSSAKMRVLKPKIDAINAKYPMEKMQERQQATMELYRKAGVSPLSGCLPMLFQFPVLMAMFWFFPTAIELRGKSLFWADDLSTYDAIITWGTPIPLLGDHLSLFCLLMTLFNFAYTYITMQTQATDQSMKFMKWMMYLMPLMFLFIFNDYAAGLSYYYLLSLFFTIFQTMLFRLSVDDTKLLAQMEENAKKKVSTKKSGFLERLERMQREQLQNARRQAKENAKKMR